MNKDVLDMLCTKDCKMKSDLVDTHDYPSYMAICNNCIHSIKMDHFVNRKEWERAEQDFEDTSILHKMGNKVINFLVRGQR